MKYARNIAYFALFAVLLFSSCKVVKHSDVDQTKNDVQIYFDNGEFDATAYVTERWESEIIPRVEEHAIEADKLITLLKKDAEKAATGKWAVQIDKTAPVNYMVYGTGEIIAAKLDTAAATVEIKLKDGTVSMQIGPVIKYTSIRDSLDFIKFEDFTNQLEYANVSREINKKVKDEVLAELDRENLIGTKIEFLGCFTDNKDAIIITPVNINLNAEGDK